MAASKHMKPVFDRAEDLLSAKAAYWVDGNVLRFALPIPIIAQNARLLQAYRLESG